jgi:hypothetical protein
VLLLVVVLRPELPNVLLPVVPLRLPNVLLVLRKRHLKLRPKLQVPPVVPLRPALPALPVRPVLLLVVLLLLPVLLVPLRPKLQAPLKQSKLFYTYKI